MRIRPKKSIDAIATTTKELSLRNISLFFPKLSSGPSYLLACFPIYFPVGLYFRHENNKQGPSARKKDLSLRHEESRQTMPSSGKRRIGVTKCFFNVREISHKNTALCIDGPSPLGDFRNQAYVLST